MIKHWLKLKRSVATIATLALALALTATASAQTKVQSQSQSQSQSQPPNLHLDLTIGRTHYAVGDTVAIEVRATVPHGYHLYSNPLGPGIGKPLNLFVNRLASNPDVRAPCSVAWVSARKSFPKRYNPPIGSWVWAYESDAYFFVRGVLVKDSAMASAKESHAAEPSSVIAYEVIVDALICQTACIPVVERIPFELQLPKEPKEPSPAATAFPAGSGMQSRYAKSEPMAFRIGAPDAAAARLGGAAGMDAAGLDLGGLSNLAGAAAISSQVAASPQPTESQQGAAEGQYAADGDGNDGMAAAYNYSPLEDKREYSLLTAILFALLAGLALNLTPCIFPMLGVRVLSFAESARESRRSAVVRSAVFSLGIVSVFLLLAALAAFAGFSWGQHFQSTTVMIGIIALVFLFALGLFDFYTIGVPAAVGNAERKAGANLAGDFLKGAIATVMATPCGGPFLGALLAWALLQRPLTIFILFAVMGVGMALPYVLLSSSKRLLRLLPKPGRWIEDFKHFMGFLLLAFAVNMMRSLDPYLTAVSVGICLSLLFAASVHKRFAPFGVPTGRRIIVVLVALALLTAGTIASAIYLRVDAPMDDYEQAELSDDSVPHAQWVEFSPQALLTANAEGRNVIVNFTASWCTNCKLNKAAALNTAAARELYVDKNVLLLTADVTTRNPEAQELLYHLGSRSVPFLAIFPADVPGRPVIMRDIISKDKYLRELRGLPKF